MEETNEFKLECGKSCRVIGEVHHDRALAVTYDVWDSLFEPIEEASEFEDALDTLAMAFLPLLPELKENKPSPEMEFPLMRFGMSGGISEVLLSVEIAATAGDGTSLYVVGFEDELASPSGGWHGPV